MPTPSVDAAEPSIVMQVRGARGMLGWSQIELAERAGIAPRTLANFEAGRRIPHGSTIDRIVAAFAEAGVELFDRKGGFGLFFKLDRTSRPTTSPGSELGLLRQVSTISTTAPELTK